MIRNKLVNHNTKTIFETVNFCQAAKSSPLNIPFIVDTTIRGGTFQTPILQDITYGQRNRSRLFHTREDKSLPFHYAVRNVRSEKLMLECSNHRLSNCKGAIFFQRTLCLQDISSKMAQPILKKF